jgi:integrase/recombinase XerC
LLTEYLDYLEIEKNYSQNTIKQYKYDLLLFKKIINVDLLFAQTSDIRAFLANLKRERNYSAKTLMRKQATLRSFYKFCVKQKKMNSNPVLDIESPKIPQRIAISLTEQERHLMFKAAREKTYTIQGKRNYTILVFLYYTGLRVHELINLNLSDLMQDELKTTIKVIGKGNKERQIPMHPEVKTVLNIWLENREKLKCMNNAIFVNSNGKRLTIRRVQQFIKSLALEAGITKNITPHKLRHTFGTQLLEKGANLIDIQNLLGHSSLSTTQIYVHTNKENLTNAVERL